MASGNALKVFDEPHTPWLAPPADATISLYRVQKFLVPLSCRFDLGIVAYKFASIRFSFTSHVCFFKLSRYFFVHVLFCKLH